MELERLPEEELRQVSGGLTEARQQELDAFIQRCKKKAAPLWRQH